MKDFGTSPTRSPSLRKGSNFPASGYSNAFWKASGSEGSKNGSMEAGSPKSGISAPDRLLPCPFRTRMEFSSNPLACTGFSLPSYLLKFWALSRESGTFCAPVCGIKFLGCSEILCPRGFLKIF